MGGGKREKERERERERESAHRFESHIGCVDAPLETDR